VEHTKKEKTKLQSLENALPKLTKMTKTAKIQFIKDALREGKFDRDETAISLGIKDRQVRRYLNEIAQEDALANPDNIQILRGICASNLLKKAALGQLNPKYEVAIVLASESKKIELKEEIKVSEKHDFTVTMRSFEATINKVAERYLNPDSPKQ
jgi:hypothetical protein